MRKTALTLLIFILTSFASVASSYSATNIIEDVSTTAQNKYIQEQVYVMTDRELYMPTDTLWFNAWVVNAETKQKAKSSEIQGLQFACRQVYMCGQPSRNQDQQFQRACVVSGPAGKN